MGLVLFISSYVLLLFFSEQSLVIVVASTILHAVDSMFIYPYLESVLANVVSDEDRTTFYVWVTVVWMIFSSPSGYIDGITCEVRPEFSFLLLVHAFKVSIVLMLFIRENGIRGKG